MNKVNYINIILSIIILCFLSCADDNSNIKPDEQSEKNLISAVDISSFPEISKTTPNFTNSEGATETFLDILSNNGINTIRLRLWVDPSNEHSGYEEVRKYVEELKLQGFDIWLSLHYSDKWADPGSQETPESWQGSTYSEIKLKITEYTAMIAADIKPEIIQIGNEINSGFLFPYGNINSNSDQFKELLSAGIQSVRESSENSKILIHYAGIDGAEWFYDQLSEIDYDIIGLSYYPIWHGKSLDNLQNTMQSLSQTHNKEVMIAETAYPFTLDWNDWTNNIVGLEEQLILPEYPATESGQKNFIHDLKTIIKDLDNGVGFCYWGAELIAWNGMQSTSGSPWENQALFDFDNKALPVLTEFNYD